MWVLEASGEILQGRRMWLRPGKQYLFGRVKKDGVRFVLDHKTVSRKHFVIEVSEVATNEVSQIHSRTKITIIDQESKSGTHVNGEPLKGKGYLARELKQARNSIRPGTLDQELRIIWVPCVLTYNLLKKDLKSGALKAKQDRLRQLGVKVVADFLPDASTHVVVNKRNTAKALQALICGKWLVDDSFIEALEVQATPSTLSQEENPSQLELNFDSAWPLEKDHLPAPGREPTLRPVESYAPGPDRTHIFENYVFVFLDTTQYDNLLPVITSGHGKVLSFKYTDGRTTVEEALNFLTKAAGQKVFGASRRNSAGGAVLVRWNRSSDTFTNSEKDFVTQLALKMDQRVIEQSEFLDAILANDASLLRQQVPLESLTDGLRAPPPSAVPSFAPLQTQTRPENTDSARPATQAPRTNGTRSQSQLAPNPSQASAGAGVRSQNASASRTNGTRSQPLQNGVSQIPQSNDGEAEIPTKKPRYRAPTQVKFDDDFNPDDIVPFDDDVDDDLPEAEPSQVDESGPEATPAPSTQRAPAPSRKRHRSPSPASDGAGMDDLLSATNAMKRQRREFEEDLHRKADSLPKTTTIVAAPKPKTKELNVKEALKLQREREKAKLDADNSEEEPIAPPDPENREPAHLAVVAVMDLPVRRRIAHNRGQNPEDDPRWEPRWNGLRNFKKFRPQEKGAVRRSDHASKIIVPLVPMAQKKTGLGDEYWEKTPEERAHERKKKRREEKRRAQESLSQRQADTFVTSDDDSDEGSFRIRRRHAQKAIVIDDDDNGEEEPQTSPAATRLQEEAEAILDHDIDMDSPRRTRADDAPTQTQTTTQRSSGPSSSSKAATQKSRGTKRPATSLGSAATSKKRQKTLPVQAEDDSGEDSDDMKFRFGKGKGRK